MFMLPAIISKVAAERHREMLAQAEQDRLASQLGSLARASRRAERAKRRMLKARRLTLRVRSELTH